jgi:hypothetical protein
VVSGYPREHTSPRDPLAWYLAVLFFGSIGLAALLRRAPERATVEPMPSVAAKKPAARKVAKKAAPALRSRSSSPAKSLKLDAWETDLMASTPTVTPLPAAKGTAKDLLADVRAGTFLEGADVARIEKAYKSRSSRRLAAA